MMLPGNEDALYRALLTRDPAYDGFYFVGVRTTGVYCRLTCAARKPKRSNVAFFQTIAEARAAGFRPCRRCRPDEARQPTSGAVFTLKELVAADPTRRWSTRELEAMGLDPSTARRAFRREYGVTFAQYARAGRLGQAVARLHEGRRVIDAQLEAGYESSSGFREAVTAWLGQTPAAVRSADTLIARWLDTPLGPMLAVADAATLLLLEFADRRGLPGELRRLRQRRGPTRIGTNTVLDAVARQLGEYFAGGRATFDVRIGQTGSPFQRAVWEALGRIAPGETRSYGALARELGRPSAVRAVARANGANTVAILVPCHRVIGADGTPTGYGGGIWRKRWLLEHESRRFGTAPSAAGV